MIDNNMKYKVIYILADLCGFRVILGIDYIVRVASEVLKKQKYPILPTKLTFVPDEHVWIETLQ